MRTSMPPIPSIFRHCLLTTSARVRLIDSDLVLSVADADARGKRRVRITGTALLMFDIDQAIGRRGEDVPFRRSAVGVREVVSRRFQREGQAVRILLYNVRNVHRYVLVHNKAQSSIRYASQFPPNISRSSVPLNSAFQVLESCRARLEVGPT